MYDGNFPPDDFTQKDEFIWNKIEEDYDEILRQEEDWCE